MNPSTLFICKTRTLVKPRSYSDGGFSSGLYNSAQQVSNMIANEGYESLVVHAVDNNDIDRLVTKYKPSHVFIEALWVVPSKFKVLSHLHPHVKWIVRIHSETPFLAGEGIAMSWIFEYIQNPNVQVAFNSHTTYDEFLDIVDDQYKGNVIYLPNYYTGVKGTANVDTDVNVLDVGCFGAIRPLKNQLIQATSAVKFAQQLNRPLRFHINSTRVEGKGDSVLKNLRSLFDAVPNATLVEHEWLPHHQFVELISSMDINMQVSLSETFNIVTADAVVNNVPVVVSGEVDWICRLFRSDSTSSTAITLRMWVAYVLGGFGVHSVNKLGLKWYNFKSRMLWTNFLRG